MKTNTSTLKKFIISSSTLTMLLTLMPMLSFANGTTGGTGNIDKANTAMAGTSTIMNKIVGTAFMICGGFAAIFLMWSIMKDVKDYTKGNGSASIWKIGGKVLFTLLCIGLIMLSSNWQNAANKFAELQEDIITKTKTVITEITPASDGGTGTDSGN